MEGVDFYSDEQISEWDREDQIMERTKKRTIEVVKNY